jgi:hypothetical protein
MAAVGPTKELSADELQAAWIEVHEPGWPTLEELQRTLARYHQVRAAAQRHRQVAQETQQIKWQHILSAREKAAAWITGPRVKHTTPQFDAKRLASGERPDDDAPST